MPLLIRSKEATCRLRSESNAAEYYSSVLKMYEEELESSNGDPVVRMDLIRLKDWIRKYISWAYNWHFDNYQSGNDITDNEFLKERWPPPPKAPKLKIFQDLN